MAQQHLDHPDIDLLLQEMGGKAVSQRVERDLLVDLRCLFGSVKNAAQLAAGQRVDRVLAWKQPATPAA